MGQKENIISPADAANRTCIYMSHSNTLLFDLDIHELYSAEYLNHQLLWQPLVNLQTPVSHTLL